MYRNTFFNANNDGSKFNKYITIKIDMIIKSTQIFFNQLRTGVSNKKIINNA